MLAWLVICVVCYDGGTLSGSLESIGATDTMRILNFHQTEREHEKDFIDRVSAVAEAYNNTFEPSDHHLDRVKGFSMVYNSRTGMLQAYLMVT